MISSQLDLNTPDLFIDLSLAETFLVEHRTSALLPTWLTVAAFLFFTGLVGMICNYKNFLVVIMCVEVMYLGAVTSFVLYGAAYHDPKAAVYALLILIFGACESAVGLGLLIVLYRHGFSVAFKSFSDLGG